MEMLKMNELPKLNSKYVALKLCIMMMELADLNYELFDLELEVLDKKIETKDKIVKSEKGIHIIDYPFKEQLELIELKKGDIDAKMESIKKLLIDSSDMLIRDIINVSFKYGDDEPNVFELFEPIIKLLGSLDESDKYYGSILNIVDMEEN